MSVGIGGVGWSTDLSWDTVVVAGNEAEESKRQHSRGTDKELS